MIFDLNSPSLAQYHWGTLFCRFSSTAPVQKETFVKTMASLFAGAAPWTTDEELRATIALLHEIGHLAQDLTTGLGHSDHLTHKTETKNLLFYASLVIPDEGRAARPPYRQPGAPPWFEDKEDTVVAKAQGQLRYYPFAMIPGARRERIRTILEKDFKPSVDDALLFTLSAQSILECDAAMTVIHHLQTLERTAAQTEILKRNTALYSRDALGPEYWEAFALLRYVIGHHTEMDEEDLELVLPSVFGLFVDSALACPPPEWIQARGESFDAYEPTVKFARLLIAFQELAGTKIGQFWDALRERQDRDAEAILLGHAPFPYPSSEDILNAWIGTLDPLAPTSIVAEIRRDACRYRLDHGVLMRKRNATLLFAMETPILYLHKDYGFVKHDWGVRMLDTQQDVRMTQELVNHFMLMELGEFLFRTGEFRCPHAQADTCPVVEDDCLSGHTNLAQFPESSQCIARSWLIHCGIDFPAG